MKKIKILSIAIAAIFALSFLPLDVFAKGGGGFGGGARGFSGGGFSGGSRSFGSSGGFGSSSRSYSTPSYSPKPSVPLSPSTSGSTWKLFGTDRPKPSYDSGGQKAGKMAESQRKYESANSLKPSDSWKNLKHDLSYERMENRKLREQQSFSGYHDRTYTTYNDGFNVFFWLWLLDRPRYERDTWVYHHHDEIDAQRYNELKKNDPDLEKRLSELEKTVKKDSSYTPSGVDRDLMYSDDTVKKAYEEKTKSSFPWVWVFVGLFVGAVIYLVFFVRFNVKKRRY